MATDGPQPPFTPKDIEANLRDAEERKQRALAEYKAALAEIEWWKQGQRLFGGGSSTDNEDATPLAEQFPPAWAFDDEHQPTLRQAIVAVMREAPGRPFRVAELAQALEDRGWLPDRDSRLSAKKRVSDLASLMIADGQLERADRGVYTLDAELDAALEVARQENVLGRENTEVSVDADSY
jgi:hypothetical protein